MIDKHSKKYIIKCIPHINKLNKLFLRSLNITVILQVHHPNNCTRSLEELTNNNPSIFGALPLSPRYKAENQPDRCTTIKIFINAYISRFRGFSVSLILDYDRYEDSYYIYAIEYYGRRNFPVPVPTTFESYKFFACNWRLQLQVGNFSWYMWNSAWKSCSQFPWVLIHLLTPCRTDSRRRLINDGAF